MLYFNRKTFGMALVLILGSWQAQAAPSDSMDFAEQAKMAREHAKTDNAECLACHGNEEINHEWKTQRGKTLELHTDAVAYNDSVHQDQSCLSCHEGDGADAFDQAPHAFKDDRVSRSCDSCHENAFPEVKQQLATSHHTKTIIDQFGHEFECQACHDAHSFNLPNRAEDIIDNIEAANESCFSCHNDYRGYESLTDKKLLDQKMGHWFLPEKGKHFASVRCVDCHSAGMGTEIHTITPAEEAISDCQHCHSEDSAITTTLYKYSGEDQAFSMLDKGLFDDSKLIEKNAKQIAAKGDAPDSPLGFMNEKMLDNRYVIGATPVVWLDRLFGLAFIGVLALLALHAALRFFGKREKVELVRTSTVMFPVGVRLWHNSNVIVFLGLLLTGLSMHFSLMAFDLSQTSHNVLGAILILLWVMYLIYLVISGQIKQYLPRKNFIGDSIKQAKYYLLGIYTGKKNPAGHDPKKRLNPLQQQGYVGILFGAFPLLILSGVGLFFNESLPAHIFGMDGKEFMVLLHVAMSHIMVLFIVSHIYLCTTGATVTEHFKSMATGKLFKAK